jgi:hypothetical protein
MRSPGTVIADVDNGYHRIIGSRQNTMEKNMAKVKDLIGVVVTIPVRCVKIIGLVVYGDHWHLTPFQK